MGAKKGRMFWIVGLIVVVVGVAVFATTSDVVDQKKHSKRKDKSAQVKKDKKEAEKHKIKRGRTSATRVTNRAGEKKGYVTVRKLTTNPDNDGFPSWSPDGQEIVFQAEDDSYYYWGIWKINADGTGLTPLALPDDSLYQYMCFNRPSWSPDGSKIAYNSYADTTHGGVTEASIFVMDPDGSNRQRFSLDTTECYGRGIPGWSPDSKKIVCKNDSLAELIVIDIDAGTETNINALTPESIWVSVEKQSPKFSPDGSKILFKSDAGAADGHMCVIDISGANYTVIDPLSCTRRGADWSPDGEKIVYTNDIEGSYYSDIWIADADGTGQTPILENEDECLQEVAWQPVSAKANGKWIVYAPTVSGDYDLKNIWVVSTDGLYNGCLVNQTTKEYWHVTPTWSPQGDKIVFASDYFSGAGNYDICVIDLDTDDNDLDGLLNWEEFAGYGTDPEDWDTDGGGESDGSEVEWGRDPLDPDDDEVINLHDICAVAITVPVDTLIKLHAYTPAAVARNDGPTPESFRAYLKVVKDGHLVYTAFVTVGNMPGGATDTVYFSPDWVPRQVGGYTSEFIIQSELDKNPANNVCSGQLWVKDISGPMSSAGTKVFFLDQNAPNPMHDITSIRFQIPQTTHVSLKIYDTSGRLVRTLVNETKQPGDYTVSWDGKDTSGNRVAHGVYLYEIKAGKYESHKKIIVQ